MHTHMHTHTQTYMCAQEDQCSLEPFLAVLYFCSFMLVCSYILLQLVIGIILDSIQAASSYDFLTVGPVCVCCVCMHAHVFVAYKSKRVYTLMCVL